MELWIFFWLVSYSFYISICKSKNYERWLCHYAKSYKRIAILLYNGLNKGKFEIDQINDVGFVEGTTIEDTFTSSIPCTNISVDEIVETNIFEIRKVSNKY